MKHDKDKAKTPFHLIPLDFVAALAVAMAEGLKGTRKSGDWMRLKWDTDTRDHYYSALMRHTRQAMAGTVSEPRDWLSVACNAMILWYHSKKGKQ